MTTVNDKFPFITCYARILDRTNFNPITKFEDALDNTKNWDLGLIHNNLGGYSQCLIELDIWNNEPSVSAGLTQKIFNNAEDCSVFICSEENFSFPLFQIRNSTMGNKDMFTNIFNNDKFTNIYGNVNPNKVGILQGISDHVKLQIGVNLPPDLNFIDDSINFKVCFQYSSENTTVNLFFNCNITLVNKLSQIEINYIGEPTEIFSGEITSTNYTRGLHQTTIEAYDLNGVLKDQHISIIDRWKQPNNLYKLYLTSGTYNFIIKNNLYKRNINNIEVSEDMQPYYNNIDFGLISKIYDDIVEYQNVDVNVKQIIGYIKNEYDEFVENAEIIITQDSNVIVNYVTNESGQYKFCLANGIYDIRIRSKRRDVKIFRNFSFEDDKGFFTEIAKQSSSFNDSFNFICNY